MPGAGMSRTAHGVHMYMPFLTGDAGTLTMIETKTSPKA